MDSIVSLKGKLLHYAYRLLAAEFSGRTLNFVSNVEQISLMNCLFRFQLSFNLSSFDIGLVPLRLMISFKSGSILQFICQQITLTQKILRKEKDKSLSYRIQAKSLIYVIPNFSIITDSLNSASN